MGPEPVFRAWKSDLLYNEESISDYAFGGYHPICLGDKLDQNRYEIRHKLGVGSSSTVWLAGDAKLGKWVAIKILKANVSEGLPAKPVFQGLGKEASKYIIELLDTFIHRGPNGSHQCLVFELLGPTMDKIATIISPKPMVFPEPLEPENILRIAKQLLEVAASLHGAGYMHGDIWPTKVAFTSKNNYDADKHYTSPHLSNMSEKEIMEILGSPVTEKCIRLDSKPLDSSTPAQLVASAVWEDWIAEDEEDIRLLLFAHDSPDRKTPEALFTDTLDYRVDLFRIGFVIYTLLFSTEPFSSYGDVEYMVTSMVDFIEPLPEEWEPTWTRVMNAHKEKLERHKNLDNLKRQFDLGILDSNLKELFPVVQGLMRFRPSDRMEASKALELVNSIIKTQKMAQI